MIRDGRTGPRIMKKSCCVRDVGSCLVLAGDGGDAESYAMQAQIRQSELAKEAQEGGIVSKDVFQPVAPQHLICAVLLRESTTHHDYDDAARAYQLVSQWQPSLYARRRAISSGRWVVCIVAPDSAWCTCLPVWDAAPVLEERIAQTTSAFFVGIQDRHHRNLGQIEAFSQQVDANQRVELPPSACQFLQQFHPFESVQFTVQPATSNILFLQKGRQVFGQTFGQRRYQNAFVDRGPLADLVEQMIDLPASREPLRRPGPANRSGE